MHFTFNFKWKMATKSVCTEMLKYCAPPTPSPQAFLNVVLMKKQIIITSDLNKHIYIYCSC